MINTVLKQRFAGLWHFSAEGLHGFVKEESLTSFASQSQPRKEFV